MFINLTFNDRQTIMEALRLAEQRELNSLEWSDRYFDESNIEARRIKEKYIKISNKISKGHIMKLIKCDDGELRFDIIVKHRIGKHELIHAIYYEYDGHIKEYPKSKSELIALVKKLIKQNVDLSELVDFNYPEYIQWWDNCVKCVDQIFPEINEIGK